MSFKPASWLPSLPPLPDVPLCTFMFDEQYGRASFDTSLDPYVCAETGKRIAARQQKEHVELLARGLGRELGWQVNQGSEYEKVMAVFALNTIDLPTVTWAVHRLNGICAPISASYTAHEVAGLLKKSKAKGLFTVLPLLPVARKAAEIAGIAPNLIYVLEMSDGSSIPEPHLSFAQLLHSGQQLPQLEEIRWEPGESARRTAFLSHSSGTSGPPKMAAVSHQNIISGTLQLATFEQKGRGGPGARQVALGMLPSSHVYGVVVISHLSTYRGDSVIVLPRFDMEVVLASVEKYRIEIFGVVPPIIVAMAKTPQLLQRYDLSSIKTVVSGGASLDKEATERLQTLYPKFVFRNAYGMTEVSGAATLMTVDDTWAGSAGMVIPGAEVKILKEDGSQVTSLDEPGEVYVRGPGVVLGYMEDSEATNETFVHMDGERWLRTGDIGLFRRAASGSDHIFIVDRIKEVIKVKVVPAELESCILTHPAVLDCAVIGVPDERAGERPFAYIQKTESTTLSDADLALELVKLVETQKARYKRLSGGIEMIDDIPRSPSGKVLRRILREKRRHDEIKTRAKL